MPFWLSYFLTPLPLLLGMQFVLVMCFYFFAQLPLGAEYFCFFFFFVTYAASVLFYVLSMTLAAITGNVGIALAVFPWYSMVVLTFAGYIVQVDNIPIY